MPKKFHAKQFYSFWSSLPPTNKKTAIALCAPLWGPCMFFSGLTVCAVAATSVGRCYLVHIMSIPYRLLTPEMNRNSLYQEEDGGKCDEDRNCQALIWDVSDGALISVLGLGSILIGPPIGIYQFAKHHCCTPEERTEHIIKSV